MRNGISFTVSASDSQRLQAIVAAPGSPHKHVKRVPIVLLSGDGLGTWAIMLRPTSPRPVSGAGRRPFPDALAARIRECFIARQSLRHSRYVHQRTRSGRANPKKQFSSTRRFPLPD